MRSMYKAPHEGLYFITSSIVEWISVFTSEKYFKIITDSLSYCQINKQLKIFAYVILDNHFHLITYSDSLPEVMKSFKRYTAQMILYCLQEDNKNWLLNQFQFYKLQHKTESEHQVWQEGYHPQIISTDYMFQQKADYIHMNPVKRGLVDEPEHWRFSSARYYIKQMKCDIEIDDLKW